MTDTVRIDGRRNDQLRPIRFQNHIAPHAAGSTLIEWGNTRVICAATVEESVPRWMKEQKVPGGWLSAEYSMLPYSTLDRKSRDISKLKLDGRSQEIQRLIGRALRAVVDLGKLGSRTLCIDCAYRCPLAGQIRKHLNARGVGCDIGTEERMCPREDVAAVRRRASEQVAVAWIRLQLKTRNRDGHWHDAIDDQRRAEDHAAVTNPGAAGGNHVDIRVERPRHNGDSCRHTDVCGQWADYCQRINRRR